MHQILNHSDPAEYVVLRLLWWPMVLKKSRHLVILRLYKVVIYLQIPIELKSFEKILLNLFLQITP